MTQEMERYLKNVKRWMFGMPRKTKRGVIDELRSHIMESALAMGGPSAIETVLRGMDPPRKTAKRYKQIYGYGLLFKVIFVIIIIFLSIWTVPIWEVVNPDFSTTFVFLILIIVLFLVGSKAGKRMALFGGISAFITRFFILGVIVAIAGEHGIIQGGSGFAFFLSSVLLILVAYLPARTIEKWEERKTFDFPLPEPYETSNCPRCEAIIPVNSKFCSECGGRIY